MNLSEYSDSALIDIWIPFWYSADIEPDIRGTPEGITENQWVTMVYLELQARNIQIPVDYNFWES